MRAVDVIMRKRDGHELSHDELAFLVNGYTGGEVPDYQMSAFLMAVYFRGMTDREIIDLTRIMIATGDTVSFPQINRFTVDKHSTGGVGDKTTLVLAPLLASFGLVVPKLSGRGLGHGGGTIDKLEAIPGFRTDLSIEEFQRIANDVGVVVASATANLVPADHKMYELRDVTATVDSIPLIAGSIMSKKLAVHNDALVLDVKVGNGAFFTTLDQAHQFAEKALEIGKTFGRALSCVLTGMEQPLGYAIGNALEVKEAIQTLHGNGPEDLVTVCAALAGELIKAGSDGGTRDVDAAVREKLQNGQALATFKRWIEAQGGDPAVADDPDSLPRAKYQVEVSAPRSGYIAEILARPVGELAVQLGAGRARKEDEIDPGAGIVLRAKSGEKIEEGDTLAVLHTDRDLDSSSWEQMLVDAIRWSDRPHEPEPTILDVISGSA